MLMPLLKYPLLLLVALLCLNSKAQQTLVITYKANDISLKKVLNDLNSTYGIQFAYSTDQINIEKKVSLGIENGTLEQMCKALFSGTNIQYTLNGNQVILYKNPNYTYTISGRIREKSTGELLIGVIANTLPAKAGCVSNHYGFYSLALPEGTYTLYFHFLGFKSLAKQVTVNETASLDIELEPSSNLNEVIISSEALQNRLHLNMVEVPLKAISEVPMILGEKDVLKYMMLMPGLQKGNEGNSYLYVRGGSHDQNLVLMDDAVIYNAYHLYGLSSLFTGSELRNAELIKGGFSSRYGGRLSSVLNMSLKDGNRAQLSGEASSGIISSHLILEGPIIKNKASFMVSGRRSYINEASQVVAKNRTQVLGYYFYDLHGKVSADITPKDRLMLSAYFGNDVFANNNETEVPLTQQEDGINWGNRVTNLRWNHQFSKNLFINTAASYSNFFSRIAFGQFNSSNNNVESAILRSSITDITFKSDWDYSIGGFQFLKFGAGFIQHRLNPSTSFYRRNIETTTVVYDSSIANNQYMYGEYENVFWNRLKVIAGIRLSFYQNNVSYVLPEPRANVYYTFKHNWEIGASYTIMNQFLHSINTFNGLGFPSDVWLTTNESIKPQQSQLATIGVKKKNWGGSLISTSVEGYYKYINNVAVMREGASFFLLLPLIQNEPTVKDWRSLLTQGEANSYGVEWMVRKDGDKLSGFVSYTWSKTMMQVDAINFGNSYPANFDRRHDFAVYINYKLTKRFSASVNWIFGTGYPLSLPLAKYYTLQSNSFFGESVQNYFQSKNAFRMENFHRLDASFQYEHKIGTKLSGLASFSVYNIYNRNNPFFYEITARDEQNEDNTTVLKRNSLFPVMPSISYTIKF